MVQRLLYHIQCAACVHSSHWKQAKPQKLSCYLTNSHSLVEIGGSVLCGVALFCQVSFPAGFMTHHLLIQPHLQAHICWAGLTRTQAQRNGFGICLLLHLNRILNSSFSHSRLLALCMWLWQNPALLLDVFLFIYLKCGASLSRQRAYCARGQGRPDYAIKWSRGGRGTVCAHPQASILLLQLSHWRKSNDHNCSTQICFNKLSVILQIERKWL